MDRNSWWGYQLMKWVSLCSLWTVERVNELLRRCSMALTNYFWVGFCVGNQWGPVRRSPNSLGGCGTHALQQG